MGASRVLSRTHTPAGPFCQRVLLTLEEKGLPYSLRYVDEYSPPAWLGKVTHDKRLPAIKDLKQARGEGKPLPQGLLARGRRRGELGRPPRMGRRVTNTTWSRASGSPGRARS